MRGVALIDRDPEFQTDGTVTAMLDFGQGRRLDFTVSTQSVPYQRVQAVGTKQRLEIEIPFNAPLGGATRIFIDDASAPGGPSAVAETLARAILNMRVIDALFKSGNSGGWEDV